MSISSLRRQVKNKALSYSDAQICVREATSNDPRLPEPSHMADIAKLTLNPLTFVEVMGIIWKRLGDGTRCWRHVFKSLMVLEFMIKAENTKVAQQCRENLQVLEALREFKLVENDVDQGLNIREKADEICSLLENKTAKALAAESARKSTSTPNVVATAAADKAIVEMPAVDNELASVLSGAASVPSVPPSSIFDWESTPLPVQQQQSTQLPHSEMPIFTLESAVTAEAFGPKSCTSDVFFSYDNITANNSDSGHSSTNGSAKNEPISYPVRSERDNLLNSFLGANSSLVDMDNLIRRPSVTEAKSKNPFLDLNAVTPTMNQLMEQRQPNFLGL